MDPPTSILRGSRALWQFIREQTIDVRRFDLAGFRQWLEGQLARWESDLFFVQRVRIRELRRAHPELAGIEDQHRRAVMADAASPQFPRLNKLERELIDARKAIAGLTAALPRATRSRRSAMQQKIAAFRTRQHALENEQSDLIRSCPQRQQRLRIDADLEQIRARIGLDHEEARLARLAREQGQRRSRSGESFEQMAEKVVQRHVVPDLQSHTRSSDVHAIELLTGVTLGASRVELDQVVVKQPSRSGEPVDVLAIVEVKRNINDLARGFRQRQENLAWLTGDPAGYDAQSYRTRQFQHGHFDRDAVHEEHDARFVFTRRSFHRFRRDPTAGLFLNRLYFVSRSGPLWGLSTSALSRLRFRIATDERWDLASDACLDALFRWCRSMAEPLEAPDVLELYAAHPRRARRVLLVDRTA